LDSRLVRQLVGGLPDLTGGEAVLETGLDHHAPVADQGRPPSRSRPHPDPADRQEWFRNMPR
jgi:ribosomal protection tetracycline resistance protein